MRRWSVLVGIVLCIVAVAGATYLIRARRFTSHSETAQILGAAAGYVSPQLCAACHQSIWESTGAREWPVRSTVPRIDLKLIQPEVPSITKHPTVILKCWNATANTTSAVIRLA